LWLISHQAKTGAAVRRRPGNPEFEQVRADARQLRAEGASQREICQRLKDRVRPPQAAWRHLPWDRAYMSEEYRSAVCKWLSKNCRP
jgi:hypothetical protein